MAIIATFATNEGTKAWMISPACVMDLDNFSTGYELNAESNDSIEGSPLTNQRGMKKKNLSFSTNLVAAFGIDVRKEFESWEEWIGRTGTLTIGGEKFGPSWLLTSVKPSDVKMNDSGRFLSMKLTFAFEENGDTSTPGDPAFENKRVSRTTPRNARFKEEAWENTIRSTNSASSITASSEAKASVKAANAAFKEAAWEKTILNKNVKLGDIVYFTGGSYYSNSSASATKKGEAQPGQAKVEAMCKSAAHPYYLKHINRDSKVDGFVDASKIR